MPGPLHFDKDAGLESLSHASTGQAHNLIDGYSPALDDKVTFNELARMAGLPVPDTRRLTSKAADAAITKVESIPARDC